MPTDDPPPVLPVVLVLRCRPDPMRRTHGIDRHPIDRLGIGLRVLGRNGWELIDWKDLYPSEWLWSPGEGI